MIARDTKYNIAFQIKRSNKIMIVQIKLYFRDTNMISNTIYHLDQKHMESIYYLITDNATEIISLFQSFSKASSLSFSSKYLSKTIYNVSMVEITSKYSLFISHKFANIKTLIYDQQIVHGATNRLLDLSTLENLAINYTEHNIIEHIDFNKLNRLTSFELKYNANSFFHSPEYENYFFDVTASNLKRLILEYSNSQFVTTLIDCPSLIYLHLDSKSRASQQVFEIKYDNISNLQELRLRQIDFDMNCSFDNLKYLKIQTYRRALYLTHLQTLESVYLQNIQYNIVIANLRELTDIKILCCRRNITIQHLIKLKNLYIDDIFHIEISSLNNLNNVTLLDCRMSNVSKIKFFEMKNIKHLNINDLVYHKQVEKRLIQLKQEKRAIEGECSFNKLISLKRLTHLILINNSNINDVRTLKYLKKLTVGSSSYYPKEIKTKTHVNRINLPVEYARTKYTKYID